MPRHQRQPFWFAKQPFFYGCVAFFGLLVLQVPAAVIGVPAIEAAVVVPTLLWALLLTIWLLVITIGGPDGEARSLYAVVAFTPSGTPFLLVLFLGGGSMFILEGFSSMRAIQGAIDGLTGGAVPQEFIHRVSLIVNTCWMAATLGFAIRINRVRETGRLRCLACGNELHDTEHLQCLECGRSCAHHG